MTKTYELTEEQKERYGDWILAGEPGPVHEHIGITKAQYEEARAVERARVDAFFKLPSTQSLLATMWAHRTQDSARWEDDGGVCLDGVSAPPTGP